MQHDYHKGDLVWWALLDDVPLPFNGKELFIGIVTAVAERAQGVEVFWLNNGLFKIMHYEAIMRAKPGTS
jgi:hypothetical protein